MTPKEKAKELVTTYYNKIQDIGGELGQEIIVSLIAKECALIALDEILLIEIINESVDDFYLRYWQEVKTEIENL
jgi:hypothetical protein